MQATFIRLGLLLGLWIGTSGCNLAVSGTVQTRTVPDGDRAEGQRLVAEYGCGACHRINGVPGAVAEVGPPLNDFHQRSFVAGHLPNTWENLALWLQNPQEVVPGTAMPNLGVSEVEARHIAAFLYDQPAWYWPGGGRN